MSNNSQTKHIGIVACSAEGAALCYRTICLEGSRILGANAHPEISLHTHSLADYVAYFDCDDWEGVGELILSSAEKLATIGADILICPDNTIHQALPFIESQLPLRWLHIAEVVVKEAVNRGYRHLGLTGTRWLVESSVYPDIISAQGLTCTIPDPIEREQIHRITQDELIYGVLKTESIAYFQTVIQGMKENRCDAVILGCTEIPLIIDDSNSPLPTLDSTRLLAQSALRESIKNS